MKDLFGKEVLQDIKSKDRPYGPKLSDPNPMVYYYGEGPEGKRCKHCAHCIKKTYAKTYYKCAFRKQSNSAATDIRANWPACGKFEMI